MNLPAILSDKTLKAKAKVEAISDLLLSKKLSLPDLIKTAKAEKDKAKGDCIEALEFATRQNPALATAACLTFVTDTLAEEAPRVKWESAKVIGNIAAQFPDKLGPAIAALLKNAEHTGTVVRWSAAFALGEIVKLRTKKNKELIPAIESILRHEEGNAIRKMYQAALKKALPS